MSNTEFSFIDPKQCAKRASRCSMPRYPQKLQELRRPRFKFASLGPRGAAISALAVYPRRLRGPEHPHVRSWSCPCTRATPVECQNGCGYWPGNSAQCIGGRAGLGPRWAPLARDARRWPPKTFLGLSGTMLSDGEAMLFAASQYPPCQRPCSRAVDHRDPASATVKIGTTPAHHCGRARRDQSSSQSVPRASA